MRSFKETLHIFQRFFKNQNGDFGGVVTLLLSVYMFLVGVALIVNYTQVMIYKSDIQTAGKETMGIMRTMNGADYTSKQLFDDLLTKMKIDPSKVTFVATSKTKQRGDQLLITATSEYPMWALNMVLIKNVKVPINESIPGVAHKLIR